MKKHWIEFTDQWQLGPMTFWVHASADGLDWHESTRFDPPRPRAIPGKGFPVFYVEVDGFTFVFSSLAELDACIDTLAQNPLPATRRLAAERCADHGPNTHWLSRLPAKTKSLRYRRKAVAYLETAREAFLKELGSVA